MTMTMQIDLTGKIVLITGATGQLGRTMTRTLAGCGADVAIHYHHNRSKAEELQAEIEALGRRAVIVQADITSADSMNKMRDDVLEAYGRVDIIVANAVSQYAWTSVLEQPAEDYLDQFNSCVMQSVHLFKAFVPGMIERNYGRFVGINTECSMQSFPTQSAYVAGKRGMDGLYRVMAKEVGPHNITINQVAPGWTISERDREAGTEKSEGYDQSVPLRRRGTDQEISNAVAFLSSDLASFITGVYLPVAGGNVMPAI
jgi:3-oxoacyl-[acyl-carrier protein] reductase